MSSKSCIKTFNAKFKEWTKSISQEISDMNKDEDFVRFKDAEKKHQD